MARLRSYVEGNGAKVRTVFFTKTFLHPAPVDQRFFPLLFEGVRCASVMMCASTSVSYRTFFVCLFFLFPEVFLHLVGGQKAVP